MKSGGGWGGWGGFLWGGGGGGLGAKNSLKEHLIFSLAGKRDARTQGKRSNEGSTKMRPRGKMSFDKSFAK